MPKSALSSPQLLPVDWRLNPRSYEDLTAIRGLHPSIIGSGILKKNGVSHWYLVQPSAPSEISTDWCSLPNNQTQIIEGTGGQKDGGRGLPWDKNHVF